MSNEWVYGEYRGTIDLVDRGDKGPWALLDAEKIGDDQNTPMVQIGLTEDQFNELNEDDNVTFTLTQPTEGGEEAFIIYNDESEQNGIYIVNLRKV